MQRLEVSGAVRPIYGSLGAKRLTLSCNFPTPTLQKMISIRSLAVSYVRTVLKQNKSQMFRLPSCRKTIKVSLHVTEILCITLSVKHNYIYIKYSTSTQQ